MNRSAEVSLVAARLRNAYNRFGLDTSTPRLASEFKSLFGTEIPHLQEFFEKDADLPLGDVLKLCELLNLPASEILAGTRDQEHLQIFDYLGGGAFHVVLPPGLIWDRNSADSLFYILVEDDRTEGFWVGDLLVCMRVTLNPQSGCHYLIEDDRSVRVLHCVHVKDRGMVGFSRFKDDKREPELVLPADQGLAKSVEGVAVLRGRVVWRLSQMPSPENLAR